jgi:hypothetical protein
MNVLAIVAVHNERKRLPALIDYYRKQGIDVFVIDNESTDTTYKYLLKNKIKFSRLYTKGAFDLNQIWQEKLKYWDLFKADWGIYADIDEFPVTSEFKGRLKALIEKRDSEGYNRIRMPHYMFFPVNLRRDPKTAYFYQNQTRGNLAKFKERIFKLGDHIKIDIKEHDTIVGQENRNCINEDNSVVLHYSLIYKGKKEFASLWKRRKKAYKLGLIHIMHGEHYGHALEENKWVWEKKSLYDIRKTKFYDILWK